MKYYSLGPYHLIHSSLFLLSGYREYFNKIRKVQYVDTKTSQSQQRQKQVQRHVQISCDHRTSMGLVFLKSSPSLLYLLSLISCFFLPPPLLLLSPLLPSGAEFPLSSGVSAAWVHQGLCTAGGCWRIAAPLHHIAPFKCFSAKETPYKPLVLEWIVLWHGIPWERICIPDQVTVVL